MSQFYQVDPAPRPLAELTAGLPAAPAKKAKPAHTTPPDVDWDLPENLELGRDYLHQRVAAGSVAVEHDENGRGGNITLFKIACQMRDFMISEETARELVWEAFNPHCQPPWAAQDETFLGPFRSAYGGNAENPQPGRDRYRSGAEIFRDFTGQEAPTEDEDGLMSLEEMDARPNPRELVKGFLIEGELIGLLGMPKHGKTFVGLDINYSIMAGTSVLAYFEVLRQGPAVYLSGEGHQGMKRRWHAWKTLRGIDKPNSELPFVYATFVPQAQNAVAEAKQTGGGGGRRR